MNLLDNRAPSWSLPDRHSGMQERSLKKPGRKPFIHEVALTGGSLAAGYEVRGKECRMHRMLHELKK